METSAHNESEEPLLTGEEFKALILSSFVELDPEAEDTAYIEEDPPIPSSYRRA